MTDGCPLCPLFFLFRRRDWVSTISAQEGVLAGQLEWKRLQTDACTSMLLSAMTAFKDGTVTGRVLKGQNSGVRKDKNIGLSPPFPPHCHRVLTSLPPTFLPADRADAALVMEVRRMQARRAGEGYFADRQDFGESNGREEVCAAASVLFLF